MKTHAEKENTCLLNALSYVGLDEITKAGPSFEELRAFPSPEEEEKAGFGNEQADKEEEEGMPDQKPTEDQEEEEEEAGEMGGDIDELPTWSEEKERKEERP